MNLVGPVRIFLFLQLKLQPRPTAHGCDRGQPAHSMRGHPLSWLPLAAGSFEMHARQAFFTRPKRGR